MNDNELILHIGPPKCASTAIQHALGARRKELAAVNFHVVAGRPEAVKELVGLRHPYEQAPRAGSWRALARELRQHEGKRVVYSDEFLAFAQEDAINKLAADLGVERISIVFGVRPLSKILPSYWQQNLKAGLPTSFEEWLQMILSTQATGDLSQRSHRFWQSELHHSLAERWAKVFGKERITAIVLNERLHQENLASFASLIGAPRNIFDGVTPTANRSLSRWEAAALQRFNKEITERTPDSVAALVISSSAGVRLLARDTSNEPQMKLPAWAQDQVQRIEETIAAGLRESGIHLVGDVSNLIAQLPPVSAASVDAPTDVAAEIGATIAIGAMETTGVIPPPLIGTPNSMSYDRKLLPVRIIAAALIDVVKYRIAFRMRLLSRRLKRFRPWKR